MLHAEVSTKDNSNFGCLKFTARSKSEILVDSERSGGYTIRAVTE